MWLSILQTSPFISLNQTSVEIITPCGVHQQGISVLAYVLGKAWHHSAASNCLYLSVWQCYIAYLSSYLQTFCNSVWQAWKNLCTIGILSNKDRWCLVSSSSNIYCDHPQSIPVLARIRTRVPYISQWYCIVIFQQGTQLYPWSKSSFAVG
jgi:hypothetical protein